MNRGENRYEKPIELKISGSLTAPRSAELKNSIFNDLNQGGRLQLVISDVDDVDITFLQILSAAMKTARSGDGQLTVRQPVPGILYLSIIDAGLQNHGTCDAGNCLWCEMVNQSSGA